MPNHDSRAIANWFVERAAQDRGRAFTPMQLQKLVYVAHGWNLALNNAPLIQDRVEAWDYGPVIPDLYLALKKWGAGVVSDPIIQIQSKFSPVIHNTALMPSEEEVLEQVYQSYGGMSGAMLSNLTHADNTPWKRTYVPGVHGSVIDNRIIADHFSALAQRYQ